MDGVTTLIANLKQANPFLDDRWAKRLVRAYGTEARDVIANAKSVPDLGEDFGATLTEAEVIWLMKHEFARRGEDIVWRRNKLGLVMTNDQVAHLDRWMIARSNAV